MKNTLPVLLIILIAFTACDETQKMMKPVLTPIAQEPVAPSEAPLAEQLPLRPDESQRLLTPVTEEPVAPIEDPFPEEEISTVHSETVADKSLYVFYTPAEVRELGVRPMRHRGSFFANGDYEISYEYADNFAAYPNVLDIPLYLFDPETDCISGGFTDNPRFIKPKWFGLFNYTTGEPFRRARSIRKGELPPPLKSGHEGGWSPDPDAGDWLCPTYFFYVSSPFFFLKDIETPDMITPDMIGVRIDLENGEVLTWQLSEIYDELPPYPPKRER